MVQGTASSVGKSIFVAALCRIFKDRGLRVAPFKAQNMSNNAAVTRCGGEIGRAQAMQAAAARIEPTIAMNPILLKPEGDAISQVIVRGKVHARMTADEYHRAKSGLKSVIVESLKELQAEYDLVIIEGAGSPAEINLKDRDIVNMHVARVADAPVILVGDIDRGGIFASFVGTLELLDPDERERVRGFIVNKFRGDAALLEPGLRFIEERTGRPVFGTIPWIDRVGLADEDSISLDHRAVGSGPITISVVRYPRISNFDDFLPLENDPRVSLKFTESASDCETADLVILPGSKSTVGDLAWLRERGFESVLKNRTQPTLGICGGCQMLGTEIRDPNATEGLGLLPVSTTFFPEKRTTQIRARAVRSSFLARAGEEITGYEIHAGRIESDEPIFEITHPERRLDGSSRGAVVGTMIHGIFENQNVRDSLLGASNQAPSDPYDRVARIVIENCDIEKIAHL